MPGRIHRLSDTPRERGCARTDLDAPPAFGWPTEGGAARIRAEHPARACWATDRVGARLCVPGVAGVELRGWGDDPRQWRNALAVENGSKQIVRVGEYPPTRTIRSVIRRRCLQRVQNCVPWPPRSAPPRQRRRRSPLALRGSARDRRRCLRM